MIYCSVCKNHLKRCMFTTRQRRKAASLRKCAKCCTKQQSSVSDFSDYADYVEFGSTRYNYYHFAAEMYDKMVNDDYYSYRDNYSYNYTDDY